MGHGGTRGTGCGLMGSGSAAPLPKAGAVLPPWAVWAWWHTGHGCGHPLLGPSPKGTTLRSTRRGKGSEHQDCLWHSFSSQPGRVLSPFPDSKAITPPGPCAPCGTGSHCPRGHHHPWDLGLHLAGEGGQGTVTSQCDSSCNQPQGQ